MHDAAFARAAVPSPTAILKLPLRPYSVGHALWLLAAENPLADENAESAIRPQHVVEAVWTCAHSWRELAAQHRRWLTLLKLGIWRRRARREDLALAAAEFQNYRRAGSSFPPIKPAEGDGRNCGAPVPALLIQFLAARLGKSEEAALDYPLGLAYWHFSAYQERQGVLQIKNAAEIEFEDWCLEQEAAQQAKMEDQRDA